MALIGISGYINSGKDTVGKIIQYLECKSKYGGESDFHWDGMFKDIHSSWQVKKFAGKLKQIASLMTGIPIEKFEDQEFKKTFLGKEWSYDLLHDISGHGYEKENKQMTVREFLQKLGTEAIREGLHTNAWVNALMVDYKPSHIYNVSTNTMGQIISSPKEYPNWIITDTRFPNEAEAIKEQGGIIIRVNRESPLVKIAGEGDLHAERYVRDKFKEIQKKNLHPSEIGLDDYVFDYVLENDGSIEELIQKVKIMLEHFKLL